MMSNSFAARLAVALALIATVPGAAFGQGGWVPGSEILSKSVQVTTNGVTNGVTLGPGGAATITTSAGNVVNIRWTAGNGQLCLINRSAQECWPYAAPFRAGQPVTLTSSCNSTSTWLAVATN